MSNFKQVPEGKDPELWKLAKKRSGFKKHATVYIIINAFLWGMWFFRKEDIESGDSFFKTPIFTTLGWGIGLAFHYVSAYVVSGKNSIEKEYEKLKNQQ